MKIELDEKDLIYLIGCLRGIYKDTVELWDFLGISYTQRWLEDLLRIFDLLDEKCGNKFTPEINCEIYDLKTSTDDIVEHIKKALKEPSNDSE